MICVIRIAGFLTSALFLAMTLSASLSLPAAAEQPSKLGRTASSSALERSPPPSLTGAVPPAIAAAAGPFMRIHGQANPPYGFVQFCDSFPAECVAGEASDGRFNAGPERLAELDAINRHVNATIEPVTDMDLYGVPEWWAIPALNTHGNGKGDCEDYALLKRQILISRGWPVNSVLMTVVRDEKGDGHAVLTARTAQGDFILDNKAPDVRLWNQTSYKFVMRQSYLNVKVWMSLDPKETVAPGPMAGVKPSR
jgi:predicted transglutaminase-like cysteine proteinase